MKIVLLGPQGSGKGTQGKKLAAYLRVPHVSTGDLLRDIAAKDTELGRTVKEIINKGELVSDTLLMQVAGVRLQEPDCAQGFVLDGTPRNKEQADLLDEKIGVDKAILIDVPDEESISRISARWSCPKDKTPYNTISNPPKTQGVCDLCGTPLVQREDDTPEAIRFRLNVYHERTKPVLDRYRKQGKLVEINGSQDIASVWNELLEKLER